MKGFLGFSIRAQEITVRFQFYLEDAPVTCEAFSKTLPFTKIFMHARISGEEIWSDDAPVLNIIQENTSVFTTPGEVVLGPVKPARTKTAKCIGIYYCEGKGLDCANIFAKVLDEDLPLLKKLGEGIWREGEEELLFELLNDH